MTSPELDKSKMGVDRNRLEATISKYCHPLVGRVQTSITHPIKAVWNHFLITDKPVLGFHREHTQM